MTDKPLRRTKPKRDRYANIGQDEGYTFDEAKNQTLNPDRLLKNNRNEITPEMFIRRMENGIKLRGT